MVQLFDSALHTLYEASIQRELYLITYQIPVLSVVYVFTCQWAGKEYVTSKATLKVMNNKFIKKNLIHDDV